MLGTIRLPQNMKMLKSNLPESNYETDKKKTHAHSRSELPNIPEDVQEQMVEEELEKY